MSIPGNINRLEQDLQRIIHSDITLAEHEIKEANRSLQSVLLGHMENLMKQDETFRALYKEPQYTGSYYENLRVGHADEFDINFVLELPIRSDCITIDTAGTEPGFARIKVQKVFTPNTTEPVKRKIERWVENDCLSQQRVISWLQGVVDTALTRVSWPRLMNVESVRRSMSGPAVTLHVQMGSRTFDVDLVPVFRFGRDKWPAPPLRQPNNLPRDVNSSMNWCVVPKAPRSAISNNQWRMSFYMIEKALMRDLNNMKPVIKLFKLLRDKQGWCGLSSYYIKTLFMWEQVYQQRENYFWRKGLGYLFMHMVNRLETCLKEKRIRFFWHEGSNLIAHLDPSTIDNMAGRATYLRKLIERALNEPETDLTAVIGVVFTTPSQRSQNAAALSQEEEEEEYYLANESTSTQQSDSLGWGAIAGIAGLAIIGAAALFGATAARRNQRNN